MTRLLTLFVALFLAFPACAAPAIDEAGARALKPRVEDALNYLAQTMQKSGITMTREGSLMVEPAGTYYAITSPALTLKMPGNITRTVGMVAINAIPTDNPDMFKVAVALPTPMLDTDASGNTVGSLTFGSQTMNGLWNMPASAFVEMNGSYKDVRLTNNAQGIDISIPALTLNSKLTQSGQYWNGPAEAVLTNFSHKDKISSYQVENLRIKADLRELDFKAQPSSSKSLSGLTATQAVFADFMTRYANAADIAVAADNVSFQGVRNGTLKTASLQSTLSSLKSKSSGAAWNLGLDGITLTDAAAQRFTPSRIAIKGAGKKLPLDTLLRLGENDDWWKTLGAAGSDIAIENLTLDAPAYGVDAKGSFTASATAPLGGAGDVTMNVRGLQELNTFLAGGQSKSVFGFDMPPQILAALAIVQMTAKDSTDAQGRPAKSFDLKIAPDGRMLVNGADLSALTQMARPR